MARQARKIADSSVYHIILRGVNKQQIFECSDDYERFMTILRNVCTPQIDEQGSTLNPHCVLYCYCLMGNHVHLLVKEIDEPIGDTIKRITSAYVYYYNHKYDRVGHLYQERFKSQAVNDWDYFLRLLRYIHQNPLKPHLVDDLAKYKWCSWHEYLKKDGSGICRIFTVLDRIPLDNLQELVLTPLTEQEEEDLLDIDVRPLKQDFRDSEVWEILTGLSSTKNATEFQALPRPLQKHYLYCVHEYGVGPRTLSRLTGVPYAIVQRATSLANEMKRNSGLVGESNPWDEEYYSYCDEGYFEDFPEY